MNRAEKRRQQKAARKKSQKPAVAPLAPGADSPFWPYVQKNLESALQHHRMNDLGRAEDLYREVLKMDAGNLMALRMMGVLGLQSKRDAQAVDFLTRALSGQPDDPDILNNLGLALHRLGRSQEAIDHFQRALSQRPDDVGAHNNLGNALQTVGRLDDAVACYQAALKVDSQVASTQNNLGYALQRLGRFAEALTHYRAAIAVNPDYAEALNNMGITLFELGDYDEAIGRYRQALAISPGDAEIHNNLGNVLKETGLHRQAVESYEKALEIVPDHSKAHNNLGHALLDLRKEADAVRHFERANAIQPDNPAVLFNLHSTCYTGDDLQAATGYLETAARAAPEDREIRFFLGVLHDYQGQSERAETYFAALRNSTEIDKARLDSWFYVKSLDQPLPRLFGHTPQGLALGIEAAHRDGLVLEFGVRFGTSIRQLSDMAGQDVHGFDSFQGLPEEWHENPVGIYRTGGKLPDVPDNVHLHVGLFDETLPPFLDRYEDPVRFMNIDCDMYSSTRTIFDLLGARIGAGTVIVFDEYFGNAHWRQDEYKAFQEAVDQYGWRYRYLAVSYFSKQVIVEIL